jgi:hypothetical protein
MRRLALLICLLAAGCGTTTSMPKAVRHVVRQHCRAGVHAVGSARVAYAAAALHPLRARALPDGRVIGRFGKTNENGVPTVFGVRAELVRADCAAAWYRVQLPQKPNGSVGWVRAADVEVGVVSTRIVVDVSRRTLTLFRSGRPQLTTTVAVGSDTTPTPIGSFYVNQRLIPADHTGPYGPAAIGVSAFSNVLTGWAQGGPVAIHGTDEPSSIGHAVSNGCIRVRNDVLLRLFHEVLAGTPVIIHP